MPAHDIIDNRKEKLVDHINQILDSSDMARFAVGYFFLSGLTPIAERLSKAKELRLLIGNTTNRETLIMWIRENRRKSHTRAFTEPVQTCACFSLSVLNQAYLPFARP